MQRERYFYFERETKMDIKIMKEVERKYTYSQSQQIQMQTGLIGYLRADMDTDGNGFFSTWNDFCYGSL